MADIGWRQDKGKGASFSKDMPWSSGSRVSVVLKAPSVKAARKAMDEFDARVGDPGESLCVSRSFTTFEGASVTVTITSDDPGTLEDVRGEIDCRLAVSLDDVSASIREAGLAEVLLSVLAERAALRRNIGWIQTRSSQLIQAARRMRKRLMELGDPDPGMP